MGDFDCGNCECGNCDCGDCDCGDCDCGDCDCGDCDCDCGNCEDCSYSGGFYKSCCNVFNYIFCVDEATTECFSDCGRCCGESTRPVQTPTTAAVSGQQVYTIQHRAAANGQQAHTTHAWTTVNGQMIHTSVNKKPQNHMFNINQPPSYDSVMNNIPYGQCHGSGPSYPV